MLLLRSLRFNFTGTQTNFLQSKMESFKPLIEHDITQLLKVLYRKRQYIPYYAPSYESFISNLQKFYVRKDDWDRNSLKNYYTLQKMQMMTENLKRIFHSNVNFQLFLRSLNTSSKILQSKKQRIKDLRLFYGGYTGIHLLIKREFPYQQDKFLQIANNYTIKLYELHQYMNSMQCLPSWEPYIRVSFLLKMMGHQMQCRRDILGIQTLESIDRYYYFYITQLFPRESYEKITEDLNIQSHFIQFLCQKFLLSDQMDYDKYLQRIQIVDNVAANEQVNRTLDTISWIDLVEGFKLAARAYMSVGINESHEFKFCEIFWRKLQTSDIPTQYIINLLKVLIEHPNFLLDKRHSMIMRIIESLMNKNPEQLQYLPSRGLIQLLHMTQFLPIDGDSIKRVNQFIYKNIPNLLSWESHDALEMFEMLSNKKIQKKQQIVKFLNKKIDFIS